MIIAIVCPHVTNEQVQVQFGKPSLPVYVARHEQALGGPLVLESRRTTEAELLMSVVCEYSDTAPEDTQFTNKLIAPIGCACDKHGGEELDELHAIRKRAALRNSLQNAKLFFYEHFYPEQTAFERWTFDPIRVIWTSLDYNANTTTERAYSAIR